MDSRKRSFYYACNTILKKWMQLCCCHWSVYGTVIWS